MAPTKGRSKNVVKKGRKDRQIPGKASEQEKLQAQSSVSFVKKQTSHYDEHSSETHSAVNPKTVIQVHPETTPASRQSNKTFKVKRLTDVFTRLPKNSTSTTIKTFVQERSISQDSRAKQKDIVSHNDLYKNNLANMSEGDAGAGTEQGNEVEQVQTDHRASNDFLQLTGGQERQQQGSVEFFCYPVNNTEKCFKDENSKLKPRKKRVANKRRTAATDEPTEVLLWRGPLKKRSLRDLTDLEVALSAFKYTVKEFSGCVSDRNVLMLTEKFADHFERSVVEKLQNIEDIQRMLQELNKLKKENKALSLNLGSLTDGKIKLQNEIMKRKLQIRGPKLHSFF